MKTKWIYIGLLNVIAICFLVYAVMFAKNASETCITASVGAVLLVVYLLLRMRYIKQIKNAVREKRNASPGSGTQSGDR